MEVVGNRRAAILGQLKIPVLEERTVIHVHVLEVGEETVLEGKLAIHRGPSVPKGHVDGL